MLPSRLAMPFSSGLVGLVLLLASVGLAQVSTTTAANNSPCRCGPEDKCWPSDQDWANLNNTVDGQLIKTIPIGAVCRTSYGGNPTYDAGKCAALKAGWSFPDVHLASSSSVMQQLWANGSCDPFDTPDYPCTLGEYVRYSVEVTKQEHVLSALAFVKKHNIRLVIRNTGHDDLGKSTGYGSLGIWLHKIKGLEYVDAYGKDGYDGPAIKVMAGDQSGPMLAELAKHGKVAVGGACPTVGVAGGYTPAGGHSPLSSLHGLSADNVLEMEVITADGNLLTLSPSQNQDLFWAMRGGGPGTFAIVWSLVTKAHPDVKVSTANLSFQQGNKSEDDFFKAVKAFNAIIPAINDAGGYTYSYYYLYLGFNLDPLFAPGLSVDQVSTLLKPFTDALDSLGFQYNLTTATYPTYYEAYNKAFAPWGVGGQFGSRLIPRQTIESNADGFINTTRQIYDALGFVNYISFAPNKTVAGNPDNAVLPQWRDTDIHLITGRLFINGAANFPENIHTHNTITNVYTAALKKLLPDGGVYMNEADGFDPDWQKDFYGVNYPRLLSIKQKYDPNTIFWCNRAVGSEALAENKVGVLCRT